MGRHDNPLRGRDGELGALTRRIDLLEDGGGSIVVVTGPPGSGKSRLLHEAREYARARNVRSVVVAGDPDAALVPGDGLLRGLGPVLRVDPMRDRAEGRYWLLQEVQEGLEQAARQEPLLIAVDDLQWCDDLTMLALRILPERLAGYPILWLFAGREADDSPGYASTRTRLDADGATGIVIDQLDDDAAARMAADLLGAEPSGELLALAHSAGNSPLLIRELMTGIREEGRTDLPARVRTLVRRRLARLPAETRTILEVGSVLSRRLLVPCLSDLLRLSPADLLASMRVALAEDLLRDDGGDLVFRHDLVREAIRSAVPAAVARALRREAAAAAARSGAGPLEVAALMADSAEIGDREAIAALRAAAAELASGAPSSAADLSRRALALTRPASADHQEITAETVRLLWLAGRAAEATRLGHTLLADDLRPEAEAAARIGIAAVSSQYSFAEAVRQCTIAAGLPGLPVATRAPLLALEGVNRTMTGDIAGADRTLAEALAAAAEAGDQAARALALASLSVVALYQDDWAEATALADQAVTLSAGLNAEATLWGSAQWRGYLDTLAGRPDLALRHADTGMRVAQRDGQAWLLRHWSMDRCRLLYDAGLLADAQAEAEGVLAMADELGAGNYADCTALVTAVRVALHTGDLAAARRHDTAAERMRADEAPLVRRAGRWIGALVAAAQALQTPGRSTDRHPGVAAAPGGHLGVVAGGAGASGGWRRVRELLREAAEVMGTTPGPALGTPVDPADDVVFVRLSRALGEHGWAARAVEVAEARSAANPAYPFLAATALHARGLLDDDLGRIAEAAGILRGFPRPLPLAAALEDLATTDTLEEALGIYETAGAIRDAARVRGALRRLGVRRRPAAAAGAGTDRWSLLTATERAVVEKVAAGATNRQVAAAMFLSPHTVNTHLRHAFTKLDISSRVELARLYAASL